METTPQNLFDRFNRWLRESVLVKLVSIGFLILILMIPTAWVISIIVEREARAEEVISEIASKWSGPQTINGPVLIIPYTVRYEAEVGQERLINGKTVYESKKEMKERVERAYFLPEQLTINGTVQPEVRHRGIFEAAVYTSTLDIHAIFTTPVFDITGVTPADIRWGEAQLAVGISDLRGISDNPVLRVGGRNCTAEPANNLRYFGNYNDTHSGNGVLVQLPWKNPADFSGEVGMTLPLKGSGRLYVAPTGKTTEVTLGGPWADPSFDGNFLPDNPEVRKEGFHATWKVLHYNRPFAQRWYGEEKSLAGSDFGVKLLIPVDQYQKSMRSAKYGVLVIVLTFVSLFMVELIKKVRIHPFQYILIGVALTIYYTLLLSVAEQVGYNTAYAIATVATLVLLGLYSTTFFKARSLTVLFTALLGVFYLFIFVIIQLQDYSLLVGSIGLFFILGAIMYFSRGIKWYGEE